MAQIRKLIRVLDPADREELDRRLRERRMTYNEIVAWLATLRCDVTPLSLRKYAIDEGLRKVKPRYFSRIDKVLCDDDRVAYEKLLSQPRTTVAVAREWLGQRGYSFAGDTVVKHRRGFLETLKSLTQTARLASAITQLAREHGPVTMSDGMLTRFEQVMIEQMTMTRDGNPIPTADLADMSKSVASAIGAREQFEAMRREFEQTKSRATDAADHAAKSGATGREVVERVREILGMPPLPAALIAEADAKAGGDHRGDAESAETHSTVAPDVI